MDKWFKDILPDKDPYHNRGRDQMRKKGVRNSSACASIMWNQFAINRFNERCSWTTGSSKWSPWWIITNFDTTQFYYKNKNKNLYCPIRVITKLPNSGQSYKGKVKTHKYITRYKQTKSVNNRKTVKTVTTLSWYRHF